MSFIINKLKNKYWAKVKNTKDLIYKDNIINPHNIYDSYQKLVASGQYEQLNYVINSNSLCISKDVKNMSRNMISKYLDEPEESMNTPNTSEIHHSLWIEGIHSSKKEVNQVLNKDNKPNNLDSESKQIIKNYDNAISFIKSTKNINEQNISTLYSILSTDIDMGNNKLDGYPYRKGEVEIGTHDKGVSSNNVKTSMDCLISQINNTLDKEDNYANKIIFDIIISHYVFESIHPYYDMNGRMGRLLMSWMALNYEMKYNFSEAINIHKNDLYSGAFKSTKHKDYKYDTSFFVASLSTAFLSHKVSYKIYGLINNEVKMKHSINLSNMQQDILISLISKDENKHYKVKEFIDDYKSINPAQISKALSSLVSLKIIQEVNSKPKEYKLTWNKKMKELVDLII